jgi:hypothetical protein
MTGPTIAKLRAECLKRYPDAPDYESRMQILITLAILAGLLIGGAKAFL